MAWPGMLTQHDILFRRRIENGHEGNSVRSGPTDRRALPISGDRNGPVTGLSRRDWGRFVSIRGFRLHCPAARNFDATVSIQQAQALSTFRGLVRRRRIVRAAGSPPPAFTLPLSPFPCQRLDLAGGRLASAVVAVSACPNLSAARNLPDFWLLFWKIFRRIGTAFTG